MSGLVVVTGPTAEPVSLAEVKEQVKLETADQDGLITGYLLAAREACEKYTGRTLAQRTYDLSLDFAWPRHCGFLEIELPKPPKISVTSVSYVDTNGATQVLSGSAYQLTERNGFGLIVPAYGQSWPAVRCQYDAVTVRYIAGYGAVPNGFPESIRQAIMLMVANFDANREPVVTGTTATELPMSVRSLLAPFVVEF